MQDIKKMRDRILQAPVTEGMTKEQLHEFYEATHEENRGHLGPGVWDCVTDSGASYQIEEKPMSDDLRYGHFNREQHKQEQLDHEVLAARQDKNKQIEKWKSFIEKMQEQIKRIQADSTMDIAKKQRKILRCTEIIKEYETSIANAEKFLAAEAEKNRILYEKYNKTK